MAKAWMLKTHPRKLPLDFWVVLHGFLLSRWNLIGNPNLLIQPDPSPHLLLLVHATHSRHLQLWEAQTWRIHPGSMHPSEFDLFLIFPAHRNLSDRLEVSLRIQSLRAWCCVHLIGSVPVGLGYAECLFRCIPQDIPNDLLLVH